MKPTNVFCAFVAGAQFFTACTASVQVEPTNTPASPSIEIEIARETLIAYFDDLYTGYYEDAAARYGGDLNILIDWNADVDGSDPSALFEAACSRQLQCLPIREITYASQVDDSRFEFNMTFSNPDGSLFELGPCCGASETETPPVSRFDCAVEKKISGDYLVMCLPVYVP
jgi:hypothetical protein